MNPGQRLNSCITHGQNGQFTLDSLLQNLSKFLCINFKWDSKYSGSGSGEMNVMTMFKADSKYITERSHDIVLVSLLITLSRFSKLI